MKERTKNHKLPRGMYIYHLHLLGFCIFGMGILTLDRSETLTMLVIGETGGETSLKDKTLSLTSEDVCEESESLGDGGKALKSMVKFVSPPPIP